jgi:hypothetical protein
LRNPLGILRHIAVPKPKHAPTKRFEERGTNFVIFGLVDVLAAVEFDRKLDLAAGEIKDVAADDVLSGEARPTL